LILRCPGLIFEGYNLDAIKSEAQGESLSYERYFEELKREVDEISMSKFIPFERVYMSKVNLLDTTTWRKGFCHLSIENEVIFEPSNDFYGNIPK